MQAFTMIGFCFLSITSLLRCGDSSPKEQECVIGSPGCECDEGYVARDSYCVEMNLDAGISENDAMIDISDAAEANAADAVEGDNAVDDAGISKADASVDAEQPALDSPAPVAVDRIFVKLGDSYEEAPDDVVVEFGGSGSTRWAKVSNYCGAPLSQRWNIPCEYSGLRVVFAVSAGVMGGGTLGLTVMGDHDSDPPGEDDEFIEIAVDDTSLGRIFDHDPSNDRFSFYGDRGNLSQSVISSEANLTQAELAAATANGSVEVDFDYIGGSHDDYTPWSGVQEYFEIRLSY